MARESCTISTRGRTTLLLAENESAADEGQQVSVKAAKQAKDANRVEWIVSLRNVSPCRLEIGGTVPPQREKSALRWYRHTAFLDTSNSECYHAAGCWP